MTKSKDKALVLDEDVYAACWSPKDGYSLYVPWANPDSMVPDDAVALMAAFMRLEADTEFYHECLDWFESQKKAAS